LAESTLSPNIVPSFSLFAAAKPIADSSTSKGVVHVSFDKREKAIRRTSSLMHKCYRKPDAYWPGDARQLARLFSGEHDE
jgi:hypothetical protein